MSVSDAVLAAVKAAVPAVTVHDGHVPDDAASKYVAFYPDLGRVWAEDAANTSDLARFRFQLTYVHQGRQGLESLSAACRGALVDQVLTVPGWVLGPVQHEGSPPLGVDQDDPTRVEFSAADSFLILAART